jgi:hypothetical protein
MTTNDIIKHYKTIAIATEILGYTRQTLWNWRKSGIPYRTQVVIQFKTMGALQADKSANKQKGK